MLLALFGYMDIIIIKKWTTDYSGVEHEALVSFQARDGVIAGLVYTQYPNCASYASAWR